MYQLYIANKNYSSWSLRPWVLMRELGLPFSETLLPFHDAAQWQEFRRTGNGKVPRLVDADTPVWESLAIVEYLAERHSGVWPEDAKARAWARMAAAEMHAGFSELRSRCSMTCGLRIELYEFPPALAREVERLDSLWQQGLRDFGGPFLAGRTFTAVDAFFAPVAFRIQTYGLTMSEAATRYVALLLGLASMREWYEEALAETHRDPLHEEETHAIGKVREDLRAR